MKDAARFSWLHLTDLHVGLRAGAYLWPNVRDLAVLPDLERLHKRCGPWNAVFFTGDLTQQGSKKEFEKFNQQLAELQDHLRKLGSDPVILAVPGNHDLVRPSEGVGTLALAHQWNDDAKLRERFWNETNPRPGGLRKGVATAFSKWTSWWRTCIKQQKSVTFDEGLLPGDFRTTVDVHGLRVGVIGLNTAFLQLDGGDYERKVSLDARQIHALCKNGGDRWAREHDVCFLLTHHPPEWLDVRGKEALRGEIAPAGRFALHLYGHQHEGLTLLAKTGGAQSRLEVLGRALFGLEKWGEAGQERLHGYSAGEIRFEGVSRRLRIWPRAGHKQQAGHWAMRADVTHELDGDEAFSEELADNPRRLAMASGATAAPPATHSAELAAPLPVGADGISLEKKDHTTSAESLRQEHLAAIEVASQPLFTWPQTLSGGKWLERPELTVLIEAMNQPDGKARLILGGPGSGKSALLARLAKMLRDGGTTVLAVRADQLTRNVDTYRKLQEHLDLPDAPAAMLRTAAEHGPAVLIIDQLDALSDICDAHTQRLSLLLRLVAEVNKTPNIGIILSCRDFEFHHDHRFQALNAEQVRLAPLSLAEVELALRDRGIERREIGSILLETLRAPQHLKMFLSLTDRKSQPPIFDTYQQMLEQLWREQVIGRESDPKRGEAIEKIAEYMADEEELSAPLARFGMYEPQIEQLESVGILRRENERRIAFTHQTWFAFTRARTFIAGEGHLCDYVKRRGGSLFVRATLWSTLVNLREAAPARYRTELRALWETVGLRTHLRALLVEFLGQLQEPDDNEAALLLPQLKNESYVRQVALVAIAGSPGWFRRIADRHLPGLMAGPHAGEVWWTLAKALQFERARVLELLKRHWIHEPSRSQLALSVLRNLKVWDEGAVKAVIAISNTEEPRRDSARIGMSVTVNEIAKHEPALALRVVRALLDQALAKCRPEKGDVQPGAWDHPCRQLLDRDHGLHDLVEIARKVPKVFIDEVWPWFVEVLCEIGKVESRWFATYRGDSVLRTWRQAGSSPVPVYELPYAIDVAIEAMARQCPDEFLALIRRWQSSDLLTVHVFLASGLREVAPHRASQALDYLLGDPRRLILGDYEGSSNVTRDLLESLAPHLSQEDVIRLENAIRKSQLHAEDAQVEDVRSRFRRKRYNRKHRLLLLVALQKSPYLSSGSAALIDQESRALEDLYDPEPTTFGLRKIESPMLAAQMHRAGDEDILNLFAKLPDSAESRRPGNWMRGGNVEASWALAEMAKTDPRRALALALELESGTHERPVAYVLEEISKCSDVQFVRGLEDVILRLEERGFSSEYYRVHVAWALRNIAERAEGLSNPSFALLQSWLNTANVESADETRHSQEKSSGRPQPILFGFGRMRVLPQGNFPALQALAFGYLKRQPPARESLMDVLVEHSSRNEKSDVWRAMLTYFQYLPRGGRLLDLVSRLFAMHPGVRDCTEGVHLIGYMSRYADSSRLRDWLDGVRGGEWREGSQAYGELLVLLAVRRPEFSWIAELLSEALDPEATTDDRDRVRLGIAYMAVELWSEPEDRGLCTSVIMRLLPLSSGDVAAAVAGLFGRRHSLPADDNTNQVLDAILDCRAVLAASDSHDFALQLKNICADEPRRVLGLCNALLDEAQRTSEGVPRLSTAGRELIDISLTLQRLYECREDGLDLFERLLELGMYGARETLEELNIRPDAKLSAEG